MFGLRTHRYIEPLNMEISNEYKYERNSNNKNDTSVDFSNMWSCSTIIKINWDNALMLLAQHNLVATKSKKKKKKKIFD